MRSRDVIGALLTLLALAVIGVVYVSWQIDGTLTRHGWIALALGIGLTLALAIGLMSLVFYSHRRGYDDDAGHL